MVFSSMLRSTWALILMRNPQHSGLHQHLRVGVVSARVGASVLAKAPVPLPICPLCLVPFGLIYKLPIPIQG